MIIDISQEIKKCKVYPGDPTPKVNRICDMKNGDSYNLSSFSMCAHNGTHVDAPRHFIKNGKSIDMIPLERFVGDCIVITANSLITKDVAVEILTKAKFEGVDQRILIKGDGVVSEEAASIFAENNIWLIGTESQSVGPADSPKKVHEILLSKNVVLLEGINLKNVCDGVYFLCAQPLNIEGIEGSPCRAILIK